MVKIKTPDEIYANYDFSKGLTSYAVIDVSNKNVLINPKVEEKHQSNHPVEAHPIFFYNLGYIVTHPQIIKPSKSKNPNSIKNLMKGKVLIYQRQNFIKQLNIPGYFDWKDDICEVVVLYDKSRKKNYSLTYHVFKNDNIKI